MINPVISILHLPAEILIWILLGYYASVMPCRISWILYHESCCWMITSNDSKNIWELVIGCIYNKVPVAHGHSQSRSQESSHCHQCLNALVLDWLQFEHYRSQSYLGFTTSKYWVFASMSLAHMKFFPCLVNLRFLFYIFVFTYLERVK